MEMRYGFTCKHIKNHRTLLLPLFGCITLVGSFVIVAAQSPSAGNELVSHPQEHASCNKAMCASIVSYCLIQDKCSCHPAKNCTCCTECAVCLGDYYRQCCDCVGMRKESNHSASAPTVTSTVALLEEPEPMLFKSLTDRPMPGLRCTILRFPIIEETTAHRHRYSHAHHKKKHASPGERGTANGDEHINGNWEDVQLVLRRNYEVGNERAMCTAVYFDKCMPMNECSWSCDRMGASSYRWFHNGCCECVGPTCLNYGNMYPKCTECLQ